MWVPRSGWGHQGMIPIAIKLFLGGVFKRLSGLFSIIGRYPWQSACIALIALSALLWRGKREALAERDAARAETVELQTKINQAQMQAEAKQAKADQSNLAGQLAGNKKLDDNHANLENVRRNSVTAFAARLQNTAGSPPCRASVASVHSDTGQVVGGRADSDIAIKPEQLETFSKTEMQNAERGAFLRGLVEQGLAVPASEVK